MVSFLSNIQALIGLAAMMAALFAVVGYPKAQYRSLRELRGLWRIMAGLPLPIMAYIVVVTVIGFMDGANLAPLLFILVAPPAWIYLVLLEFTHRRLAAKPQDHSAQVAG